MLTKHQDHACKDYKEIFYSSVELLKHVANKHFKEPNEIEGIQIEEDKEVGGKDKPIVFS